MKSNGENGSILSGEKESIPLNSSLKFLLGFSPNWDFKSK